MYFEGVRNFRLVAVVCMLLGFSNVSFAADRYVTLQPGAVQTIKIGSIKRVAVGLDSVAAANVLDTGELLVIARAVGETDILVWTEGDRPYSIKLAVKMFSTRSTLDALRASVKNLDGVYIRDEGGLFIIEGDVPAATKDRVNDIVASLGQSGLVGPNILNLLYTKANVSDPMIRMDVRFIEVNKGALQKFGIRWQDSIAGPAAGAHIATTHNRAFGVTSSAETKELVKGINPNDSHFYGYFGVTTMASSMIDMLAQDNEAKTLSAPVLITQSGTEAKFLSGGELPIVVSSANGPTVTFKEYGIKLDINPRIDGNNLITSTINTEVSSIDKSVTVMGVPGLLTRFTNSVISVKDGDTIVISGIVKAEDAKTISKIPMLGNIPILGELFKSREFASGQSELVVFVTPRRTSPNADLNTRVLNPAQEKIKNMQNSLKIDSALLE